MKTKIANGKLVAEIKHRGAELSSLFHKNHKLEYMWNADPAFWGKSSPLLFPVVGQLHNNSYTYNNANYTLPRHGFAREMDFSLEYHNDDTATFLLKSNDSTLLKYPFHFELRITYRLENDILSVGYTVRNPSNETMYFSLGAHPAFKVPLADGTRYEDHYLIFNQEENAPRWNVSKDGLIEQTSQPLLEHTSKLGLYKALFYRDALVFKNLKSTCVLLKSDVHNHGVEFCFEGFPYFGIWAYPDADFVCLEPWCGIADHEGHDRPFQYKEGINLLLANESWKRTWSVKCF